jgi:hypothetical protein
VHPVQASLFGIDWGNFLQGFLLFLGSYFGTKHGQQPKP